MLKRQNLAPLQSRSAKKNSIYYILYQPSLTQTDAGDSRIG